MFFSDARRDSNSLAGTGPRTTNSLKRGAVKGIENPSISLILFAAYAVFVHTAPQLPAVRVGPSFPGRRLPRVRSDLHWCKCSKSPSRAECVVLASPESKQNRGVLLCRTLPQPGARVSVAHISQALQRDQRMAHQTKVAHQTIDPRPPRCLRHRPRGIKQTKRDGFGDSYDQQGANRMCPRGERLRLRYNQRN